MPYLKKKISMPGMYWWSVTSFLS